MSARESISGLLCASLVYSAVIPSAGCSFLGSKTQVLRVSSDPPGAAVTFNGVAIGTTPTEKEVRRHEDIQIEVKKPGFQVEYRQTSSTLSNLGILDVVGGWVLLVPFFGLLSDGAWRYDPSTFGFVLTPQTADPADESGAPVG